MTRRAAARCWLVLACVPSDVPPPVLPIFPCGPQARSGATREIIGVEESQEGRQLSSIGGQTLLKVTEVVFEFELFHELWSEDHARLKRSKKRSILSQILVSTVPTPDVCLTEFMDLGAFSFSSSLGSVFSLVCLSVVAFRFWKVTNQSSTMAKSIIVFVGNPGFPFRQTRHNVGFMVGEMMVKRHGQRFQTDLGLLGSMAVVTNICSRMNRQDSDATILLRPFTFVNLTGNSFSLIRA